VAFRSAEPYIFGLLSDSDTVSSSLQEQIQRALGNAYLLERELGGGGMSRVFVALERVLDRRVVVKVLLPELAAGVNVERFRREIQLAAQLQHPHIVPLLSAGEAEGLPYFIMPFVTGESLRTRVTREGEFPVAETLRILRDVVSALAYAHARGVIHRDVKPDNVLLSGGVAVVTDFGVAKAVSASSDTGPTGLTSMGVALGTPAYMAPEQATASPNTDHRADIYALGIMAYEMLTGSPPFSGRSAQQVLAAHVVEEPEPVERRRPAVPPMLAMLVKDCLAKRPADRPQSATEVMQTLDAIATPSGGTAATTAVRRPTVLESPARRWRKPAVAAVVGVALLLGGGLFWLRRTTPAEPTPTASKSTEAGMAAPATDSVSAAPAPPLVQPAPSAAPTPAPAPKKARRDQARSRPPAAGIAEESVTSKPPIVFPATGESLPPAAVPPPAPTPPLTVVESAPPSPPAPRVAAPAPAPKPTDPAPEIRGVIADYAGAIEAKSLPGLQRVYPGMTGLQARGWEQFFQLVRDVKAQLSVAKLDVAGGTADAQITGLYTYLNTSTGRAERQPVSFRASFRNEGGKWRILEVK
jgi:serine/threonine protein kinase